MLSECPSSINSPRSEDPLDFSRIIAACIAIAEASEATAVLSRFLEMSVLLAEADKGSLILKTQGPKPLDAKSQEIKNQGFYGGKMSLISQFIMNS